MKTDFGNEWAQPYCTMWQGLWRVEQDLKLFERRIGATHYWPLLRNTVSMQLADRLSIHAPPTRRVLASRLQRGHHALAEIAVGTQISWKNVPCADSILIPFNRKQMGPVGAVDMYCDRLLGEQEFGKFLILDNMSERGLYASGPLRHVVNWDAVRLTSRVRALMQFRALIRAAQTECRLISTAIARETGAEFALSARRFALKCAAFEAGRVLSRAIFASSGARRLFIVSRNSALDAIAAANDLGLLTAELQHGMMGQFGPYYHFPTRPHVPYAPQRILTFAPYWTENIDLPRETQAVVIGSPNPPQAHWRSPKTKKRAILTSQWVIDAKLFEIARAVADARPDWEFISVHIPGAMSALIKPSCAVTRYREI
jgi:hypothetical protein